MGSGWWRTGCCREYLEVRGMKYHEGEENDMKRELQFVLFTWNYKDDPVKEDGVGGACSTHGGDEKCVQIFDWGNKWRDHSEDVDIDGGTILKWILGKWCGRLWTVCMWVKIWTLQGLVSHEGRKKRRKERRKEGRIPRNPTVVIAGLRVEV